MKIISIITLFTCTYSNICAQENLDSLLNTISNRRAFIFVTLPDSSYKRHQLGTKWSNSERAYFNTHKVGILMSPPSDINNSIDVDSLTWIYPKGVLLKRLFPLLQDSTKDFHANAIMCQIAGKYIPASDTREKWIAEGRKKINMDFWKTYIEIEEAKEARGNMTRSQ